MSSRLPSMFAALTGDAGGPLVMARVTAIGKRARFDFQALQPAPPEFSLDDYMLILDSAHTVIVSPDRQAYSDAANLLASAGNLTAMGGGNRMMGMGGDPGAGGDRQRGGGGGGGGGGGDVGGGGRAGRVRAGNGGGGAGNGGPDLSNSTADLERLGVDTVDGRSTQHYRLTVNLQVGQGFGTHMVIETWTANLPYPIVNPFDVGMLPGMTMPTGRQGAAAPAPGSMEEFVAKVEALRKQIQGTPVKTISTLSLGAVGGNTSALEFVQTTMITDIKEVDVEDRKLQIPPGYTKER